MKGEIREEIRQKISPPLDPAVVSAGGRGPPLVGVYSKGLAPSHFIPFGYLPHSFLKVLKNESRVAVRWSWWSHSLPL